MKLLTATLLLSLIGASVLCDPELARSPDSPFDQPFWCYVTNGMSDFPQLHADGSSFRSEMMCVSREEWGLAPELIRVLGIMPFQDDTYLHLYHTVPFPQGVGDLRFT